MIIKIKDSDGELMPQERAMLEAIASHFDRNQYQLFKNCRELWWDTEKRQLVREGPR